MASAMLSTGGRVQTLSDHGRLIQRHAPEPRTTPEPGPPGHRRFIEAMNCALSDVQLLSPFIKRSSGLASASKVAGGGCLPVSFFLHAWRRAQVSLEVDVR